MAATSVGSKKDNPVRSAGSDSAPLGARGATEVPRFLPTAGQGKPPQPQASATAKRAWKPIGAGIAEKLSLRYLMLVVALMAGFANLSSKPLHHLIGRETVVEVSNVIDGDTFTGTTVPGGISARFRLRQVDAPERDQPFFHDSRATLEELLQGSPNREVVVLLWEQDDWGRYVVDVVTREAIYTEVTFVQEELVKRGMVWYFGRYSRQLGATGSLQEIMENARKLKVGLWSQENPVEPWRHRYLQRKEKEEGAGHSKRQSPHGEHNGAGNRGGGASSRKGRGNVEHGPGGSFTASSRHEKSQMNEARYHSQHRHHAAGDGRPHVSKRDTRQRVSVEEQHQDGPYAAATDDSRSREEKAEL